MGISRVQLESSVNLSFSGLVEFCQKQHTNLFADVKYTVAGTVASQMNYVRRLLISKNNKFNQHFPTSFRVAI